MKFLTSPKVRSLFALVSTIFSGILGSALVTEITVDGKIVWTQIFYTEISIYIGIFAIIMFSYYAYIYRIDVGNQLLINGMSEDLALEYKKSLVPALIKRAKSQVKKGNYEELEKHGEFLKGEVSKDGSNSDGSGIIPKT